MLSPLDRTRIEDQIGISFDQENINAFWRDVCPHDDVCIGTAFQIDPSVGHEGEDCWVADNIVPNPLYEHGVVTWIVNNPCGDDPTAASTGP